MLLASHCCWDTYGLSEKQAHPRLGRVMNRQGTNSGSDPLVPHGDMREPEERGEEQGSWSQGPSLEKEATEVENVLWETAEQTGKQEVQECGPPERIRAHLLTTA